MHWPFLSDRNWSFSPDSKWLILPDSNNGKKEVKIVHKMSSFCTFILHIYVLYKTFLTIPWIGVFFLTIYNNDQRTGKPV